MKTLTKFSTRLTTTLASLFITFAASTSPVSAASFTTALSGNNNFYDEPLVLTLTINNLDGFTGVCQGLCGLEARLSYDKTKIEVTPAALNDFTLISGGKIVLYKTSGAKNGTGLMTLTIKNLTLEEGESTTISLTDILATDNDKDIPTADTTKTIKYIDPSAPAPVLPTTPTTPTTTETSSNPLIGSPIFSTTAGSVTEVKPSQDDKAPASDAPESSETPDDTDISSTEEDKSSTKPQDSFNFWPILIAAVLLIALFIIFISRKKQEKSTKM